MPYEVNMKEILAKKDKDLEELNNVINRLGVKKRPVKIAYNPDDPASVIYTKKKQELFNKYGFECLLVDDFDWYERDCSMMVQMPMNNSEYLIDKITANGDIDCMTDASIYNIFTNNPDKGFLPATVASIDYIAEHVLEDLRGKRALIVGKSTIVGKPLALHWMNKGVTVTICGKDELDLKDLISYNHIVVLATPQPELITTKDIDPYVPTLVIDAGICKDEDGKVVGNFKACVGVCSSVRYTPVPGGVGPLTVRCLVENHMIACLKRGVY